MPESTRWGPEAPQVPRLARSLRVLAGDVERLFPHRLRASDGWLGDDAHAARASDHNPDRSGVVHAVDFTAARMKPYLVVIAAVMHPSTAYVIHDRIIWSRSTGFQPRHYGGPNPHTDHVHVSILHTHQAERASRRWLVGEE